MDNIKAERSAAQKAADARYAKKGRHKAISFNFGIEEAQEIEKAIASTGLSKVDFLRQAVKNIENKG